MKIILTRLTRIDGNNGRILFLRQGSQITVYYVRDETILCYCDWNLQDWEFENHDCICDMITSSHKVPNSQTDVFLAPLDKVATEL